MFRITFILFLSATIALISPARANTTTGSHVQHSVDLQCGEPVEIKHNDTIYTYQTVKIGDQCWMAENLRFLPAVFAPADTSSTDPRYYVWGYPGTTVTDAIETDNYKNYGVLYNYPAARDACPTGWHLPASGEWNTLTDYLVSRPDIDPTNIGNAIKSCRQVGSPLGNDCNTPEHPRWNSHNIYYGFDAVGFSALPGGILLDNTFRNRGIEGYWWTATKADDTDNIHTPSLRNSRPDITRDTHPAEVGLSIRCVQSVYTLRLTPEPVGWGTVTGTGNYHFNETISVDAIPGEGYAFSHWSGDTVHLADSPTRPNNTVRMPAQDVDLTAHFTRRQYTITATADPPEAGSIEGAGVYYHNDEATLVATAAEGHHFIAFTEDGSPVTSGVTVAPGDYPSVATHTFAVESERDLVAVFAINQYTITATAGPDGEIDPSGEVVVAHGDNQAFTITPNTGYHTGSVLVDDTTIDMASDPAWDAGTGMYTFTGVASSHTIHATFTINQYTITATAGPGGEIDPSGEVVVAHGGSQVFAISPDEGFEINEIRADGFPVANGTTVWDQEWDDETGQYTYAYVTDDHTLEATFTSTRPPVSIPNAFIPGDDGLSENREFKPQFGIEVDPQNYAMTIYNRWGEKIFTSNDPVEGWDGTVNNRDAPQGSYVYRIVYDDNGKRKEHTGSLMLIR